MNSNIIFMQGVSTFFYYVAQFFVCFYLPPKYAKPVWYALFSRKTLCYCFLFIQKLKTNLNVSNIEVLLVLQ